MLWFKTLVLWIHLIAVIIWIGGIFFNMVVVTPTLRKQLSSQQAFLQLSMGILQRFNRFTKELVGVIILSGIFNLINHGWLIDFNFSATYLQFFVLKMIIVVAIIILQSLLSLVVMPKWLAASTEQDEANSPKPAVFEKNRKRANLYNAFSIILAAAAILIGMALKYL